ncbi:MAG TPA: MBL fold metallo-hydrolase [Methanospirillum sp.]|uniref:MBL fold metallo-hydrolase n=1 Tax=Methanospirillum sp. TaxID=45200 RepID=UPI002CA05868|nr:MBL fold metallo-hydrolase [Methanospirillum sp.]HOJ96610.1 MBL fold metallo-hydrolase [Methanospirillum sp.]HOL41874.1 MBL fold metallo-hydrolase [Methanospirillum sp.]HPP77674.1 MBL fold metallo-hydrolase [Methanospirillum sp.]
MRISVLASGSKGNCVYIEGSRGAVIIDAGRSAREILGTKDRKGRLSEAGGSRDLIEGVLITHEHGDHVKGLGPLGNALKVPVYGTSGTLDAASRLIHSKKNFSFQSIQPYVSFRIGDFTITPFPVSHDATDPCGYLIEESGVRLCYCTDTGIVTSGMLEMIKKSDGVILESNHCPQMLKDGPYPTFLKRRIASPRGHLSNEDAGSVLSTISRSIHCAILAHLSEENNEPGLAIRKAHEALGLAADDVDLFAASSIDTKNRPAHRKPKRQCREQCQDDCWKISITL